MALPFFGNKAKRRDNIVAIDLGSRKTKAVYIEKKAEVFSLVNYAILDAPNQTGASSKESAIEHFKQISKEIACPSKYLSIALSCTDSFIKLAEANYMDINDLRQLIARAPTKYLQTDYPDHLFDCSYILQSMPANPEPGKPVTCKAIVAGGKQKTVYDLMEIAKAAGYNVQHVVPNLVCTPNILEMAAAESFQKEVIAIVDLGFKFTTIHLFVEGIPSLNRIVDFGGDKITQGLSEAMSVNYTEAEGLKVGMPQEIEGVLQPLIAPVGRELRASIDFFEHQHDKPVSQVYVSGAAASSEMMLKILQSELMVPCKNWNPSTPFDIQLSNERKAEIENVGPQLAVALGAGISALI